MQIFVVHHYNSGLGRPSVNVSRSHTHTQSKTPLNEWSDRRTSRYVHNRHNEHPWPQQDTNLRSQQSSSFRTTP